MPPASKSAKLTIDSHKQPLTEKMSNLELLDRAAAQTTCQVLNAAGEGLINVGAAALWLGGTGFSAVGAGAVALLASNYLCPDMPLGGNPAAPGIEGCQKVTGRGTLEVNFNGDWIQAFPPGNNRWGDGVNAVEILSVEVVNYGDPSKWISFVTWETTNGTAQDGQYYLQTEAKAQEIVWRITPTDGECSKYADDYNPIPPEALEPFTYVDNTTNCTYNVTLQGFAQTVAGGAVNPVYLVESQEVLRTDGGRMGGCYFPQTIYMPQTDGPGGGGGSGTYLPVPQPVPEPEDGVPWWATALAGAVGGAVLNQLIDVVNSSLVPDMEEADFTLVAPCDEDEQGNPATRTWEFPKQKEPDRVLAHQVALMEIMQQHLDWKTPTCGGHEKPTLEGQWVTTRWKSDEKMAHSGRRLRKLFRYRTKSTRDLGQLSSYWRSFTWTSGPVCVTHQGAWWGNPQVWASSQEEGQRVIRFAAAEAGIDPDQVGEWRTSGSRSPRYGMSGTMRVALFEDFPWVASREGPSWPNLLGKTSDP